MAADTLVILARIARKGQERAKEPTSPSPTSLAPPEARSWQEGPFPFDFLREVESWPEDAREEWDERVAIRRFDGGLPLHEAEWEAYLDVKGRRA